MAELDARLSGMTASYGEVRSKFAGTPERAAPGLFNCMLYHDLTPTNNNAEQAARYVVGHCRCRQQLRTESGMKMFGAIMTCLLTWKRGMTTREGGSDPDEGANTLRKSARGPAFAVLGTPGPGPCQASPALRC